VSPKPPSPQHDHIPVLGKEAVEWLDLQDEGTYVDGTFGAGGYCRLILESSKCKLIAIDRDPEAIKRGKELEREYPGRFQILHGTFGNLDALLEEAGITEISGIVLDLGVSSMQLDTPERGFSFRFDAPLNMRMDQGSLAQTITASDIVNTYDEEKLASIIYRYGEERKSRWIARAICKQRMIAPITRTTELVNIISSVVRRRPGGNNPATKTFQALRIYLNDELGELERGMAAAEHVLQTGGRLVIVTFHSLEDRQVKLFFKERSGRTPSGSRYLPDSSDLSRQPSNLSRQPSFSMLTGRAVPPSEEEILSNTRARSARLRAAQRTDAPAWDQKVAA
jgi:16S rRNA (cytosine1402-N4)-methyltransferase